MTTKESESNSQACLGVVEPTMGAAEGEGAMVIELHRRGLSVSRQEVFPLYYEGELAGAYVADIVVEKKVILELKSVQALTPVIPSVSPSSSRYCSCKHDHYPRLRR